MSMFFTGSCAPLDKQITKRLTALSLIVICQRFSGQPNCQESHVEIVLNKTRYGLNRGKLAPLSGTLIKSATVYVSPKHPMQDNVCSQPSRSLSFQCRSLQEWEVQEMKILTSTTLDMCRCPNKGAVWGLIYWGLIYL